MSAFQTSSGHALERNLLGAPADAHQKVEIYSGVARLARTVWASEVHVAGARPTVAIMICHPTANFLGHYALPGLAERGFGAIGFTSRYIGNDSSLIMENCLMDMGAVVRHLRDRGYEKVVLIGNSGGASIVPYYQAQAQRPTVTSPPGGGPDLTTAGLVPADGIVLLNAHPSRARLSTEWLDPAIIDEQQPFERDPALDMHNPENGPPYSAEFIERYRAAQLARNRRISDWARGRLRVITAPGHFPPGLDDQPFVVQGTAADLRFLDGAIDPSDREIGVTLWGSPGVANYMPAGIGRYSTLRSWINQWSMDDTMGDSMRWLPELEAPLCVVLGSADPTVLPAMAQQLHDAATAAPYRQLHMVKGATHYFENQPELLAEALDHIAAFVDEHV
jgi:alpha-beta hydrolase superfamily lysophospholipase